MKTSQNKTIPYLTHWYKLMTSTRINGYLFATLTIMILRLCWVTGGLGVARGCVLGPGGRGKATRGV